MSSWRDLSIGLIVMGVAQEALQHRAARQQYINFSTGATMRISSWYKLVGSNSSAPTCCLKCGGKRRCVSLLHSNGTPARMKDKTTAAGLCPARRRCSKCREQAARLGQDTIRAYLPSSLCLRATMSPVCSTMWCLACRLLRSLQL